MNQLSAWALTLTCELPVMLLLARTQSAKRVLIVAASASSITHPVAWRIASVLSADEYLIGLLLIEMAVVLAEAVWYKFWLGSSFGKSLWWSLLANTMSFVVGFVWMSLSW